MANNRLTWQNVAAPDFSGISNHYRNMSDMLGRAAQSGQNALGIFQGAHRSAADNAITQRLALAAQDPSQWDPASILGSDAEMASQRVLEGVADRPQWNMDLLAARGQEQRAQSGETRVQTRFDNEMTDRNEQRGARAASAKYLLASLRGDPNAHQILEDPRLVATGGAGIASAIGYGQTGRSEADTVRNRQIQEQARQMFPQLYASTVSVEDRNRMLGGMVARGETSPEIASALGWDGGYGSTLGGGGTPSFSTAPTGSATSTRGFTPPVNSDPVRGSAIPDFKQSMGVSESSNNTQAYNTAKGGHFGKYQFGQPRLQDVFAAGAIPKMSTEEFLNNPDAQEKAMDWSIADIDSYIDREGLGRYIGQEVGGVQITRDAMRAMAHLGGNNGMKKFLTSGGSYNPNDSYTNSAGKRVAGTSLQDYGRKFSTSSNPVSQLTQEYTDFYNRSNNLRQPQAPGNPDRLIKNATENGREEPVTPEQMQQRITDYLSPSFMEGEALAIREQMDLADPQNLHSQYQAMIGSNKNELEVANEIAEQFPGWDASRIQREIKRIADLGQMKPEQAGLLLQLARTDKRFWRGSTWNLENSNFTWSKDDVDHLINQVTTSEGERKLRMEQTAREQLYEEQQNFYANTQRLAMMRDQFVARFAETRNPLLLQRIAGIDQQLNELGVLNAQRIERNKRNPLLGLTRKVAGEATRVAPPETPEDRSIFPTTSSGYQGLARTTF